MPNRILCAALLSFAVTGGAFAASAEPPAAPVDPVVARVNGGEIHRSDVVALYKDLPAQVQQVPIMTIFPMLVDRLVERKLLADAGYKAGLQKTADVTAELHRAEIRAVEQAYLKQQLAGRLTPAALDAAYKKFVAEYKPQDEVRASHILVPSEKAAKAIIAQLAKGGDFAKLAREKSKDAGSAEKGGDLGYFTSEEMVEPFANAAFAMKPGEVSKKPVQTKFGWHVIKVEDRRHSPVPTQAEVLSQLEESVRGEITDAVVKELRTGAKIETFQADGSPAPVQPQP